MFVISCLAYFTPFHTQKSIPHIRQRRFPSGVRILIKVNIMVDFDWGSGNLLHIYLDRRSAQQVGSGHNQVFECP